MASSPRLPRHPLLPHHHLNKKVNVFIPLKELIRHRCGKPMDVYLINYQICIADDMGNTRATHHNNMHEFFANHLKVLAYIRHGY